MKFQQAYEFLQRLQRELDVRLVFIPMTANDRKIMEPMAELLKSDPDNVLADYTNPEDIQNIISSCSLLISGRLQLTIMALNSLIPGIGVANSSKIANCLNMYGLPVFNNQSTIDFEELFRECTRWLNTPDFAKRAQSVRERMLSRLEMSEKYLRQLV